MLAICCLDYTWGPMNLLKFVRPSNEGYLWVSRDLRKRPDKFKQVCAGGQLKEIAYIYLAQLSEENFIKLKEELKELETIVTGLDKGAYHGIHSRTITDNARIAYDIEQVIRHRLAWDRQPEGGFQVDFDEPARSSSSCSLATIALQTT